MMKKVRENIEMVDGKKRVLTYGTFDLLHYGHVRFLRRAKALGDYLIAAVSTDEFNVLKHKTAYQSFANRREMIEAVRYVDEVIPEETWEQKVDDIKKYNIDIVVMGSDWEGSERFEYLKEYCQVVYLERTQGISSSQMKRELNLASTLKTEITAMEVQI